MLLTIGISIHLFNTTYTVYPELDIDLGLDQYEYDARTDRYEFIDEDDDRDLHLEYSFEVSNSEDSEDSG
jgi:hypothetical protein